MDKWIVYMDKNTGDEDAVLYKLCSSEEEAMRTYETFKSEAKEYVSDTSFTGDEAVYIAKIQKGMLPITKCDEEEVSFWFEWEEFLNEKCGYCRSILEATPASPMRKYKYCPMCGRLRR